MFTTHARWYVYSSVMFVGVLTLTRVCLSVCLFVNAITVESFELSFTKFLREHDTVRSS